MVKQGGEMQWVSAVSERVDTFTAVKEAARVVRAARDEPPDLLFVFISPHHADSYEHVAGWIEEELGDAPVVGCSVSGVIGGGQELENREAVAMTAAWLPKVSVRVGHVAEFLPATREEWLEYLELDPKSPTQFVLLVDSVTCDIDVVLQSLDGAFPAACKVGGLASPSPEQPAALFAHGDVLSGGAIVVALQGACEMRAVVAQGCRPLAEPFIVTRVRGNVIKELNAGKPADVLRRIYDGMNARDLALFNTSLFLGVDFGGESERSRYDRGDFLIRNILGIDPDSGALAVDTQLEDYQVVQFHMRDNSTAADELTQKLRDLTRSEIAPRIRGALMFSCSGRGERLFGVPNHDSDCFAKRVGPVALTGFFSSGEVGPVGDKSCLHGYTSVFAVFCTPEA
jgi:small ligand-binding sensory domain FIST